MILSEFYHLKLLAKADDIKAPQLLTFIVNDARRRWKKVLVLRKENVKTHK